MNETTGSRLLGPDGYPLPSKADLTREIAVPSLGGVRALYDRVVTTGLTPEKLSRILKGSINGDIRDYLSLAEEMEERDPHYAAVLGTRKRALAGIEPVLAESASGKRDQKIEDAVNELIKDPAFPDLVEDLLDGLAKGFAVVEIIWAEREGMWWPVAYEWRTQKFFTFDQVSRSQIRLLEDGNSEGIDLAPAKFIQHMPRLKTGTPIRAGLARIAAWGFCFKSFSLVDWMAFLDVFGMPLRVGKYHATASDAEKRALLRAVVSIASDAAAIIPETMAIEFVESKSSGSKSPFENMARFVNEELSKVILGQTMTTDNGSSLGQAKVHNEIRIELLEADARQIAKTINRDLIGWFVRLNFGDNAPCPRVLFPVAKPEDITVLSTALEKLVPLGLRIKQSEVRDRIGMSAPDDNDELLVPATPAPALPAPSDPIKPKDAKALAREGAHGCTCHHCRGLALNSTQSLTSTDAELNALAQAGAEDWQAQMEPMLKQILDAADRCDSFEEFDAWLASHGLMTSDLEKKLFAAIVKGRAIGLAKE